MLVYEGSESARDNFGKFINQLQPKTKIRGTFNKFPNFFFVICVFIVEGSVGMSICLWVGEEMYFFSQLVFILISRNQGTCVWALSRCIKRIKKSNHTHAYIYIYIYIYIRGAFNKFPYFFVQAFKIVIDS